MNTGHQVVDNEEKNRYEMEIGTYHPKIEYIKTNGKIYFTHTEVPKELEGKGVGAELVKRALEDVERKGLALIPLCPFVAAYIKRHPEWTRILEGSVNIK